MLSIFLLKLSYKDHFELAFCLVLCEVNVVIGCNAKMPACLVAVMAVAAICQFRFNIMIMYTVSGVSARYRTAV